MNAVLYGRYSCHLQKDTSIEQQFRECRQYAEQQGLHIVGEYADRAISGTSDKRPEFQRMIRDAAKGKWQYVIVWKVDRFSRNRYDSAMYKARLKRHGVKVVYAKESIPEGPEGILLESVLEGSAEYYSANLAQNIRRGMRENALECKVNNGNIALGYCKGADGRFAIDPAGAAVVRDIYEMYASGMNATEICADLNSRGIRTSRGVMFNKNSLHTILKNERYTGVYMYSDIRIEGGMPVIISRELFDDVQRRVEKVRRAPAANRTEIDYLLTGKLFCGHCGSAMVGESGTSKSGAKHHYYTCTRRKRKHTCEKQPVRKDYIEEVVINETIRRVLTDEMIDRIADAAIKYQETEKDDSVLQSLKAQFKEAEKGIKNILNAIEQGIFTPSTKQRLEELEQRRAELEGAIAVESVTQPELTRDQLVFWIRRFRDMDYTDEKCRSQLVDTFVHAVYLYDDHLRVVYNYTADGAAAEVDFAFIDSVDSGGEVFDFDACCSTISFIGKSKITKSLDSIAFQGFFAFWSSERLSSFCRFSLDIYPFRIYKTASKKLQLPLFPCRTWH